jgi:adiponectin receptor
MLLITATGFQSADYILSYTTVLPLVGNIFAAFLCLGCSAAFHLMSVKSKKLNEILSRLDYGGITGLIFGTIYAVLHYSFACDEVFYIRMIFTGILLAGAVACFSATFIKIFDSPKYRPVRAGMFVGLGVSTVAVFVYLGVWKNEY